jgi:hypothetical protein
LITPAQFHQALNDITFGVDDDVFLTMAKVTDDGFDVHYGINGLNDNVLIATAQAVVAVKDKTYSATGVCPFMGTDMVEVEKAQQNALRNAVNLLGGQALYIPMAVAPIADPVVRRPVAAVPNVSAQVSQAPATSPGNAAAPHCMKCGAEITGSQGKFGYMDPVAYASWTATKNNGVQMCKTCNNAAYRAANPQR